MSKSKTGPKKHITEEVVILKASIDKGIVPVINWLNSFDSVITHYCCEGNDGNSVNKPYVIFTASSVRDLMDITRKTHSYAEIIVDCYGELLPLRFYLKFGTKNSMRSFIGLYL